MSDKELMSLDHIGQAEKALYFVRNDLFDTARAAHHWKANHDQMAARLRMFTQREDLPIDRIPAYQEVVRLQQENELLRAALKEAELCIEAFTDPQGNMPEDTGEFRDLKRCLITIRGL